MIDLNEKPLCTIPRVICCGVLEKMNLGWMKLEDGTKCMPHIKGHSDDNKYRVNNCPSCGKYVRDVMVQILSTMPVYGALPIINSPKINLKWKLTKQKNK